MWRTLTKADARNEFNYFESEDNPEFKYDGKHSELRQRLLDADSQASGENAENAGRRKDYLYDLNFGIKLYDILNAYHFTTRDASNDDIWIFLSMRVVPDIVHRRWGLSESRFFSQSRRIWLKTLWWYIHLSWAGSSDETYNILKGFTTDEIVQLVERSGPNGYRVDVTREIMKQCGEREISRGNSLFRRVMKLNTARVKILEPQLVRGGTEKYVEELIGYFDKTRESERKETEKTY